MFLSFSYCLPNSSLSYLTVFNRSEFNSLSSTSTFGHSMQFNPSNTHDCSLIVMNWVNFSIVVNSFTGSTIATGCSVIVL